MSDVSLIWCHGSLGHPWGTKSTALANTAAELGLSMEAPDFRETESPDLRVEKLTAILKKTDRSAILAGSSLGGYVATAVAANFDIQGLFLLAPAFYLPGLSVHVFSNLPPAITVIHGWSDEVVPVENSIRFARNHKADLHIFEDDHRLQASIAPLRTLFAEFLKGVIEHL